MATESRFRTTKAYDIAAAAPMIALYTLGIVFRLAPDVRKDMLLLPAAVGWIDLVRDLSTIGYFALIIALVLYRRVPVGRSTGLWPRALALTSAYVSVARPLILPRADLSPALDIIVSCLTIAGSAASILVLVWLGRSFSILPEARALKTDGPYRIVRHPLYVAEEIGNIGIMLQFLQPWSLLVEIGNIALQLWRMSVEERVLAKFFPNYAAYAARTARVVPGLY